MTKVIRAWYGEAIMTESGASKLKDYKYKGGDASLIYKYITGKLAQWVVDTFYPETLAPNLITFIGWLLVISPHMIFLLYPDQTDFSKAPPAYLCLMQAICMFVYSVMDNSDGKQARKIGASSPLGLMFDHGCDMINTFIATSTLCRVLQLGNNWYFVLTVIMTMAQFYYATLEEYFVDGLFLPIVNSVNEGILIVIIICLTSFFSIDKDGNTLWVKESMIKGFKWNEVLFVVLTASTVFTLLGHFYTIIKKDSASALIQKSGLFFYLVASVIVYVFIDSPDSFGYQFYILYVFGWLVSRIVNAMQISHLTYEDFSQFQFPVIFFTLVLNIWTLVIRFGSITKNSKTLFMKIYTVAVTVYYLFYMLSTVKIMADALEIYVFTIKPKPMDNNALMADSIPKDDEIGGPRFDDDDDENEK